MASGEEKKLILVIDDEPDIVTYLTTFFEKNGFETISAVDGNDAMNKVKERNPDLVTLDIAMPEKSGIKFYREVRESSDLAGIPVVVITAVTGFGGKPDDFKRFLATRKQVPPPDGFFDKPVDMENLLKEVRRLLA